MQQSDSVSYQLMIDVCIWNSSLLVQQLAYTFWHPFWVQLYIYTLRTEPPGEERSVDEMVIIMSCPKAARVCRLDDASAGDPITIPSNSSVICIRILQAGAKLEDDHQMAHSSVNRAYMMMNLVAAPPPCIIITIIIISFPDPPCACKDFPCPNCQKGRGFNSSFLAQLRLAAASAASLCTIDWEWKFYQKEIITRNPKLD